MLPITVQILLAWLLADILTGAVHWFEDTYMDSFSLNFLNSIAEENDLHHRKPTAMLLSSGFTNIRSAVAVGWPLAFILWWYSFPIVVWLIPFFSSFGNLIHRWAHKPKKQLPFWIKAIQKTGLFISHEHHQKHHASMGDLIPKHLARKKFCPMTNWLNPWLDLIHFWDILEFMISMFGLHPTRKKYLRK